MPATDARDSVPSPKQACTPLVTLPPEQGTRNPQCTRRCLVRPYKPQPTLSPNFRRFGNECDPATSARDRARALLRTWESAIRNARDFPPPSTRPCSCSPCEPRAEAAKPSTTPTSSVARRHQFASPRALQTDEKNPERRNHRNRKEHA